MMSENKARVIAFCQVTVDGYFTGTNGDMGWAHQGNDDPEWREFVEGNASGDGVLLFGRVTYEMMASYWPTPLASKNDPLVAERMNSAEKIVFSRTLKSAPWNNTLLVNDGLAAEIRKRKHSGGKDMAILGSGSIVSQLAQERLIDEFQIVLNPIALGKGKTLFEGGKNSLNLKLAKSRTFKNGKVLTCYEPA